MAYLGFRFQKTKSVKLKNKTTKPHTKFTLALLRYFRLSSAAPDASGSRRPGGSAFPVVVVADSFPVC